MTTCEELAPLLVSRPLGLLEPEHDALVGAHLPGCAACQGFAREVERALDAASVPAGGPEVPGEDPPGWAALARRIAADGGRQPAPRAAPSAARTAPRLVWSGLALAGALAVAVALWPAPQPPPSPQGEPSAPAPPRQDAPPAETPPVPEAPPPPLETPASDPAPTPTATEAPPEPAPPEDDEDPPPTSFVVDANVVLVQAGKVCLSVGEDDRVELGMRFEIYRGEQVVGEVVVERVLRDSCWCRETSVEDGQTIQPGDSARSKP